MQDNRQKRIKHADEHELSSINVHIMLEFTLKTDTLNYQSQWSTSDQYSQRLDKIKKNKIDHVIRSYNHTRSF